ncbi:MAG: OB-fold domain-containing protein [Streptosporangiales bacterium]|nr:OB-fold domain-containing protein [Streptosporangiales bacterium]
MTDATAAGRILPQPTLASAEFWSSGADGTLRIARCADCGAYTHPPLPACRACGGRSMTFGPVSGNATVVAYTVNQQQWLPEFPPPYVVAIVALKEDDGVRLTTNIVGCDPADVFIGMRVRVTFIKAEEVYLPLFEPAPGAQDEPGPVPAPPGRPVPRPPASPERFEDKVALTGVAQSEVGRRLMADPLSLTVNACQRAIADAGLTLADIDGLSSYPGPSPEGMSEGGVSPLVDALQLQPVWVNGVSETPGQIGAITAAMLAVASGFCRHVLCFRTVWQASHSALSRSGMWKPSAGRATGMMEFRHPFGAMSAANWIACAASAYQHRYGGSRETLGWIALNARANAARNPEAVYRDPLTMDDYLSARMISTPFGLYDCDVPVDGAVAVIVSAVDTVGDLDCTPVYVEAVGTQILERLSWDQGTLTHLPQSLGPSAHLWSRTSLRPADVDVAELYDGFTFNALSWLEGLGFCEYGSAREFIDEGRGIAIDGPLPLNTHGGQLSAGRLHGYGFVREAMLQLRGEADGRQVPGARVAAVTAGGGVPSGAMLLRAG